MMTQKGQLLLEVLLALVIAGLVLGGIVLVSSKSLSNIQYAKNQNLAALYAKEGLSSMRQMRDSSWADFSNYASGGPYTETISPAGGVDFTRQTEFVDPSADCDSGVKVTVTVSWADNKCPSGLECHDVKLVSCLLDIN